MKRKFHCACLAVLAVCVFSGKAGSQTNSGSPQPSSFRFAAPPPSPLRSMSLSGSVSDVIQQALALYDIDVVFAGPIQGLSRPVELDLRDADLTTTGRVLDAMTHCFLVPINAHLVLALQDNKQRRQEYERIVSETFAI